MTETFETSRRLGGGGDSEDGNIIARALALARTGRFRTVSEVRQALRAENFVAVDGHLHGSAIRNQLRNLMKAAQRQP